MRPLILILGAALSAFAQTAVYPGAVTTDSQLKVAVNGLTTLLTSAINTSQTNLTVSACAGFVANVLISIDSEIMPVVSCSGTSMVVSSRGYDGTTPSAHAAQSQIGAFIDAWHHNAMKAEVEAIETALGPNLSNVAIGGIYPAGKYNFAPLSPGGSITAGSSMLTLTPCPVGLSGSDAGHYVYISGGSGGAESALITGGTCTSGASSGTVTFTAANNHSGAWTVSSATGGGKEAQESAASTGGVIIYAAGVTPIHAPLIVDSSYITVQCAGQQSSTLMADLAVTPVIQFGTSSVVAFTPQIKDCFVTRAAGSIPSGSVGVEWASFNRAVQSDIRISRNDVDEVYDNTNGSGVSIQADSFGSFLDTATTAYMKCSEVAGVHFFGGEFGVNQGETSNPTQAMIFTGDCNDVKFSGTNIIPRNTGGNPQTAYAVSFLGLTNPTGYFTFDDIRFENFGTAMFHSDSGTASFSDLSCNTCSFANSTPIFALNSATQLVSSRFSNSGISGAVSLTNPEWVNFSNNFLSGAITIAGGASSIATFSGNTIGNGMTVTGNWIRLSVTGNSFYTLNLVTTGATGQIVYGGNSFDPSLNISPSLGGININQGSNTITSDPPAPWQSFNGWKAVNYNSGGVLDAAGHAPYAGYNRDTYWHLFGPGNPNGDGSPSLADSAATVAINTVLGTIKPLGVPFTGLPAIQPAGTLLYCTNCTLAGTCTGGGTGHMAISNGTNWTCQ